MVARIYQPAKNAMQSGAAKSKQWVLEFAPAQARKIDPLMGWTSSSDMQSQVQLRFETRDEAIAYAKRNKIPHRVFEPKKRQPVAKAYSDNFKYGRLESWTH